MDIMIRFINDEQGLSAVEYAIGGALVVAALVASMSALGSSVMAVINYLTNAIAT